MLKNVDTLGAIHRLKKMNLKMNKCWKAENCKRLYEKKKQAVLIFGRYSEGQKIVIFEYGKFG